MLLVCRLDRELMARELKRLLALDHGHEASLGRLRCARLVAHPFEEPWVGAVLGGDLEGYEEAALCESRREIGNASQGRQGYAYSL